LEHVGFGIAKNETQPIIQWDNNQKILTLRSTLNNTRKETIGWILVDCTTAGGCTTITSSLPENNKTYYVYFIDAIDKSSQGKGTLAVDTNGNLISITAPAGGSGKYVGFPITKEIYDDIANGCDTGFCNIVRYALSQSNLPVKCNVNTFNLIRRVGVEALNNTGGDPILNCVAEYTVTFDSDINENGLLENNELNLTYPAQDKDSTGIDNNEIRKQLKRINFYILIQEGRIDPDFNFTNIRRCTTINGAVCINGIDVDLKLPSGYEHYRWKVIKISVKPMDL